MTTTPDLLAPLAPITTLARALSGPKGFGGNASLRRRRDGDDRAARRDPRRLRRCRSGALLAATERVLRRARAGTGRVPVLPVRGLDELRSWIAAREGVSAERGSSSPTAGFHGLSLAVLSLGRARRGSSPSTTRSSRSSCGRSSCPTARPCPCASAPLGLDVDELEETLRAGARPTALYTVPDFHNPSQGTLPPRTRVRAGRARRALRLPDLRRQPVPRAPLPG